MSTTRPFRILGLQQIVIGGPDSDNAYFGHDIDVRFLRIDAAGATQC